MKTPHVFSASAAAVLAMTMAAFAQSPEQPASPQSPQQPATQSAPQPGGQSTPQPGGQSAQPGAQSAPQPTGQSAPQPASPTAQADGQQETKVTLVGCVMRETDYRKASESGKGGPLGTGLGRGDEFVLVNASRITAGPPPANAAECSSASGGEAYELGGSREKELEKFVGRRVEVTGMLKEAKTTQTAEGTTRPTGGVDPLKQDLKLFEVDVASYRELPAEQSAAAPPAASAPRQASPPPAPAAPATPPAAQPQPQPSTPAAPRQNLPRTASPLPLIGLVGLVSLASGLALRRRF